MRMYKTCAQKLHEITSCIDGVLPAIDFGLKVYLRAKP